jgi:hypothetical protein
MDSYLDGGICGIIQHLNYQPLLWPLELARCSNRQLVHLHAGQSQKLIKEEIESNNQEQKKKMQ